VATAFRKPKSAQVVVSALKPARLLVQARSLKHRYPSFTPLDHVFHFHPAKAKHNFGIMACLSLKDV
jgi:hypothetical protein